MEFEQVKEWKEKELDETIDNFKQFIANYIQMSKQNSMLHERKLHKNYYSNGNEEVAKQIVEEYERHDKSFSKFKHDNSFFVTIKDKTKYLYYASNENEEEALRQAKELFIKAIDKHFDTLQSKVENKVGTILEIKHLGGDDYRFKGELGECKVEVILAGGYNIQRLHTRWIIKK